MKKNKVILILFIIACLIIVLKQGIGALVSVLCSITIMGALIVAPFWLIAFIIGCSCVGFKEAIKELNPIVMVKEVFFEDWED